MTTTRRPKTDRDQDALDRTRAWLLAIGAGQHTGGDDPPVRDGGTADLTPDERAEKLRRRAHRRGTTRRDQR